MRQVSFGTVNTEGYEINAAETEPLLGMRMLRGYRLQVDTVEGGLVTIQPLPSVI